MEGPPIDWDAVYMDGKDGHIMELLAKVPRGRWKEKNTNNTTLLHYACIGPNVAAVRALLASGADASVLNDWKRSPAHYAASSAQHNVLELLCAAGADLRALDGDGNTPLDAAVWLSWEGRNLECACVLVANGARLSSVCESFRDLIPPKLVAFERAILGCRAVTVAFLRVKKATNLARWDRFLLGLVAQHVWASRWTWSMK